MVQVEEYKRPTFEVTLEDGAITFAPAETDEAAPEPHAEDAGLAAAADAHTEAAEPVPLHLRNAPTKLMKQLDYGKGYEYAHNDREAVTGMDCLPPSLAGKTYYEPTERGFEKEIKRRLEAWEKIKQQRATGSTGSK
jgi:putative ATPase